MGAKYFCDCEKIVCFRNADLLIGGQNTHASSAKIFSESRPYFFEDDLTWCVRRAALVPPWKNYYYIMSLDLIIPGLFLMMFAIVLIYLLTTFEERSLDIWTSCIGAMSMLILFPAHLYPRRSIQRFILGWFLFAALILTTTFLAFYYDFVMRTLRETQIETFKQIVANDFVLGGDENTKNYLIAQNQVIIQNSIRIHSPIIINLINFPEYFYTVIGGAN